MSQVDEGLIHAWLDGQLPPAEAARVERLVATDAAWGAAAAEARGIIAGASRILGALDDVPTIRSTGGTSSTGGTRGRRSLWVAPWLRAAAVFALVAGIGSVLLRGSGDDLTVSPSDKNAAGDVAGPTQPKSAVNAARLPGVVATPPAEERTRASSPIAKQATRDEVAGAKKTELRVDALRAGGAAGGAVASAASGAGAGTGAGAAPPMAVGVTASSAPRPMAVADTGKGSALARQQLPTPVLGQVRGAGGGRAAASNAAAEMRDQSFAAKSLAEPNAVDPRLSGCWLPIDSAPRANDARDRGVYVLRFIEPIATDVQRAARLLVERGSVAQPAPPRAMPRTPAGARVENTSPRIFNADSSFIAEWITGNGRTSLIFTVRGDTLTGATHLAAGDIRYPGVPFRAARVQCPQ